MCVYIYIWVKTQKMVIDFAATWCGPCKFMEPAVQEMANKFSDVQFAKIDVDELSVCSVLNFLYQTEIL